MGSYVQYGKVVGVSFEDRQETIKNLMNDSRIRSVTLIHTTYTDENGVTEPAIQVKDYNTKKVLGWISKSDLNRYEGIYQMTAELGEFNGTYYSYLYMPKAPTPKQYRVVKRYCSEHGISMPLYDELAYEDIFRLRRAEAHG